jgi:hypothetical protein
LTSDTSHPQGFHTHLGLHQHSLYSGCDDETPYLLKIRENICYYVQIIDTYAPCNVGSSSWNSIVNMVTDCATTVWKVWSKKIMSISDEAFILLCLINYGKRWFAELAKAKKMVGKKFLLLFVCAAAKTLSILLSIKQKKDQWTEQSKNLPISVPCQQKW